MVGRFFCGGLQTDSFSAQRGEQLCTRENPAADALRGGAGGCLGGGHLGVPWELGRMGGKVEGCESSVSSLQVLFKAELFVYL